MKIYLIHVKGNSEPIKLKADYMLSEKEGVRFYVKDDSGRNQEVAFFPSGRIIGVTEESSFVSKDK